jgi:hypothetical protein
MLSCMPVWSSVAKGRAFVDMLGSMRLDLAAAGQDDAVFAADWAQYEALRQDISQLLLFLTGEQGILRQAQGTSKEGMGEEAARSQRTRRQVRQALDEKQEEAARPLLPPTTA